MRQISWLILVLFVSGCASASKSQNNRSVASAAPVSSPQLFFQPAYIFDFECQKRTGFKIDPSLQAEFQEKFDRFQAGWDRRASLLISASEQAAGRKFSRKEYSVALTLCKWTPMGDPAFIVSVRPYLGASRKEGGTQLPGSMSMFVSMIHHELLHSLVDNIVNPDFFSSSSLLEQYKTKDFNVLVHLHLLALQRAVNEKMADQELIDATERLYALIGSDYWEAWEIVRAEGVEKFLAELQAYNAKKK